MKHDLSSLRLLGTVGEPINPESVDVVSPHHRKEKCPIVDTWWQTETGGIMITRCRRDADSPCDEPFPGIEADVIRAMESLSR